MARLLVAALALFAFASGSAAPAVAPSRPLLGIVWKDERVASLVRVHPITLRPLQGPALRLGAVSSWSFSPDRSRFVVGTVGPPTGCPKVSLRFVDPKTLRYSGELPLGRGGIEGLAWLRPERLLALRSHCGPITLDVIDLVSRRTLWAIPLDGEVVRVARAGDRLVALVAPRMAILPAQLLVIDPAPLVRVQTLEQIRAGARWGRDNITRYARPGLAVDGRRAFVVPASGPVAEVDLETLDVTYRWPVQRGLLAAGASTKASEGSSRFAQWLGDGLIAIAGNDEETFTANEALQLRDRPAGLALLDTRSWRLRTIDADARWFRWEGGLLFATRHSWDSSTQQTTGMGVAAYDVSGRKRFHVLPGTFASLSLVHRGRAYINVDAQDSRYLLVDVASGGILGTRRGRLPSLLRDESSGFFPNGI